MYYPGLIFWLTLNFCEKCIWANNLEQPEASFHRTPPVQRSSSSSDLHVHSESAYHAFDSCTYDDFACLSMAASDKLGLDAIKALHRQLDDDADGNIDYAESDDFLKEELKYDSGSEKRQKAFHKNNDMHISVKDLWEAWLKSEVHNWTIEQTTDWLINNVHLPQYVPNFVLHKVTGANLPRLAVNNGNYLAILGIKDPIHKQKISLKAMDVVLFGPPKDGITWKDITLVLSAVVVLLGGWLAYQQNKKFKSHLNRMNKDMDSLQNSEQALENLQKQLEEAKQAEESAISEKENLVKMLQDSKGDFASLTSAYSESDVTHYKEEIKSLKTQLELMQAAYKNQSFMAPPGLQPWLQLTYELEQKSYDRKKMGAEKQLQQAREACHGKTSENPPPLKTQLELMQAAYKNQSFMAPPGLQPWLQLTYELEQKSYDRKKMGAEKQLQQAREACEKLRKKRSSLIGAFVSTHGKAIDDVDRAIVEARSALNEVTYELQEKSHRWRQVESLCGFPISINTGLQSLENALYKKQQERHNGLGVRMNSVDDLDNDDTGSVYGLGPSSYSEGHHMSSLYEDDSSGSELGKQDENANDSRSNGGNNFSFQIGGTSYPEDLASKAITNLSSSHTKSVSQSNICVKPPPPKMNLRAFSQDINVEEIPKPKASSSEGTLDNPKLLTSRPSPIPEIPDVPKKPLSIEDDICSTDSSLIEEVDGKKKKRKLFNFTKRSSKKGEKL